MLDVTLTLDRGEVRSFSVNYRALINEEWVEVVRYDTEHSGLHVHRFWLPKERQVKPIEKPRVPFDGYNEALNAAEKDLTDNWRSFRKKMEG